MQDMHSKRRNEHTKDPTPILSTVTLDENLTQLLLSHLVYRQKVELEKKKKLKENKKENIFLQ